jgi:phosphoglycolate phosphatase-like HAD superfamily hydrolase
LSKISLAIFDLDDTLVRSSINYTAIKQRLYNLFPSTYPQSNFRGVPILHLLKDLKNLNRDAYQKGLQLVEESEKQAVKSAIVMEGAEVIPEILLKYEIKGYIYTNNSQDTVNLYLNKSEFEFLNEFTILTRDNTNNPKPDPEGILKIIEKNYIPKDNSIYIGDSHIDAGAALRAGIRFFLFDSRNLDLSLLPVKPSAIMRQWSEFEMLLKRTEGEKWE